MKLPAASGALRKAAFGMSRKLMGLFPSIRIKAFGTGADQIGAIIVVNLDRQSERWQRVTRELKRFRTSDGVPLTEISRRFSAVDARDGRAVAPTADVDPNYMVGDHVYVQPDPRLERCFARHEPITMTRQEIAVARSHIEVWKAIASGDEKYVLVLEDDVWFRWTAAQTISRGWQAALRRCVADGGPRLLYVSYEDAGGTAERIDRCRSLFRPVRGLWFLSGYILSREGAALLLRAMPVVGPVDLWMNYRFQELGALALSSPAILQRLDAGSDNSYSALPFLARAGIIDAREFPASPRRPDKPRVLAWTRQGEREGLAMALAMLGLRVRVFDGDEDRISASALLEIVHEFDVLVDAPLTMDAVTTAIVDLDVGIFIEENARFPPAVSFDGIARSRLVQLVSEPSDDHVWQPICDFLRVPLPAQQFPTGAPRNHRVFRDGRLHAGVRDPVGALQDALAMDESPWVLPTSSRWRPTMPRVHATRPEEACLLQSRMSAPAAHFFTAMNETFPGNLALFSNEGLMHDEEGAHLSLRRSCSPDTRLYRSGAFATVGVFHYGRFEVEMRAARGEGLLSGFFLHRAAPRQEIDIELLGNDPRSMLVNVYFNPGDGLAAMDYGYRGSPYRIDLGFDATLDFHRYAIEWRPGLILWWVDGRVVHERVGWDPTPVPHLPMRLHGNLWAPRSEELAGRIDRNALPATASFRNIAVFQQVDTAW